MADQELFTKGDTEGTYELYTPPTFAESLPETHRENEMFTGDEGIKDLSGLAETHVNTVKELTDLKSAQPTIPDEYTAPQIPEGANVDDQGITEVMALAKELGITQDAFDKIIAFDLARGTRLDAAFDKSVVDTRASDKAWLENRWGTKYEINSEQASAGFRKVLGGFEDGDEMEKALADTGLLDNPTFKRIFRLIGEKTGEDVFVRGTQASGDEEIKRGPDGKPILTYPKSDMSQAAG